MMMHDDTEVAERLVRREPVHLNRVDHGARVAAVFGIHRSPYWSEVAREHLARQPRCVCCRPDYPGHGIPQVHHIFPFHYCIALGRPDLELDERNLITLCGPSRDRVGENHHLWIGHLDNFQTSNLSVVRDAKKVFFGMPANEFKTDEQWLRRAKRRLVPLELMSDQQKEALVNTMNRRMPRNG
jgi:hypothetical protein